MKILIKYEKNYVFAVSGVAAMNFSSLIESLNLGKKKLSEKEEGLMVLFNSFIDSLNNKKLDESFETIKKRVFNECTENPFYIKFPKGQKYEITDTTNIIEKAIKDREFIAIRSHKNNEIKCLRPVKIAYYEGFWYLICLLGRKNKVLKYNILNIKNITLSGKYFEETKEINDMLKESITVWFEKERNIKVKLSVDKKVAKYFKIKQYFPMQQIMQELEDGSLILECRISRDQELLPTVFSFLPYIKIMEPKFIDKKARDIINQY